MERRFAGGDWPYTLRFALELRQNDWSFDVWDYHETIKDLVALSYFVLD